MQSEGLWYVGKRKLELRPVEVPDPGPDDVLVRIEACGVCGWDVLSYAGKFGRYHRYPFIAGHEGAGRVERAGVRVSSVKVGERVAMHEVPVGTAGGALLARYALRPEGKVSLIPEASAAGTGGSVPIPAHHWIVEPAVCIVNGIVYAGIQPGDRVALIGAGYMGLLFVQALRRCLLGALVAFDIDRRRLALARELGADEAVELPAEAAGAALEPWRRSFDVAIETAGTPAALEAATSVLRPGGIYENFAWHHHRQEFDLEQWHVNGWRILNIQPGMNPRFGDLYPRTIALMSNGTISNARLVTHVAPVEKAAEVFEAATDRTGGYLKGVITF